MPCNKWSKEDLFSFTELTTLDKVINVSFIKNPIKAISCRHWWEYLGKHQYVRMFLILGGYFLLNDSSLHCPSQTKTWFLWEALLRKQGKSNDPIIFLLSLYLLWNLSYNIWLSLKVWEEEINSLLLQNLDNVMITKILLLSGLNVFWFTLWA